MKPKIQPKAEKVKKPAKAVKHLAFGHRERLRDRFRDNGVAALQDYELLEMILFRAIARGDVKPLAKSLLKHFGNFSAVISAPRGQLASMPGVGARVADELKLVDAATMIAARHKIIDRPMMSDWNAVLEYCQRLLGYRQVEQFHIFFLDNKNCLIADEIQQKGTINHTTIYPREIASRALELGAVSLILTHNHPSGDPRPSAKDIKVTNQIAAVLKPLNITVHDHVIVARGEVASLRNMDLFK